MSRQQQRQRRPRQASERPATIIIRRPKMICAAVKLSSLVSLLLLVALTGDFSATWRVVNAEATATATETTTTKPHDGQTAHPPVFVDTKYWIRSTEFGERDNWLRQQRPCTLFERIKMNEQSVVSMGSSMDALGGNQLDANNIYELMLAENGILLLEEDVPDDPVQMVFIDFLKAIGDCHDGDSLEQLTDSPMDHLPSGKRHLFEFEPEADEMSWFNPENWASTPNEYNIEQWIPESHQIPCSEDIVVLGDRHGLLLGPVLETGERDKTISFKLNFRPSAASQQTAEEGNGKKLINSIEQLRVSRLLIGDRHYEQQDFDKLIFSDDYGDILFQFNDSRSALKWQADHTYGSGGVDGSSPLVIDESSLVRDSSENICLDEAGCLCGNERAEIMDVVCSFNERLHDHELPCYDPIYSAGYCNKICATSLMISMDPNKFSERFLRSIIDKQMEEAKQDQADESVLVGPRRIDVDKYEILFRYMPNDETGSWWPGMERDVAQSIQQRLERGAIRSFYGIKSIKTKSSVLWRRNNRDLIFWLTATAISLISVVILAQKSDNDHFNSVNVSSDIDAQSWLTSIWDSVRQNQGDASSESIMFTENQPAPLMVGGRNPSDMHGSLSNIPLVMLDENDTREE